MELLLANGDLLQVLEHDGSRALLLAPSPIPPGSPVSLRTRAGAVFQIKVNRCQKDPSGKGFRIDVRWVSLSRADRTMLEQALQGTEQQHTELSDDSALPGGPSDHSPRS